MQSSSCRCAIARRFWSTSRLRAKVGNRGWIAFYVNTSRVNLVEHEDRAEPGSREGRFAAKPLAPLTSPLWRIERLSIYYWEGTTAQRTPKPPAFVKPNRR